MATNKPSPTADYFVNELGYSPATSRVSVSAFWAQERLAGSAVEALPDAVERGRFLARLALDLPVLAREWPLPDANLSGTELREDALVAIIGLTGTDPTVARAFGDALDELSTHGSDGLESPGTYDIRVRGILRAWNQHQADPLAIGQLIGLLVHDAPHETLLDMFSSHFESVVHRRGRGRDNPIGNIMQDLEAMQRAGLPPFADKIATDARLRLTWTDDAPELVEAMQATDASDATAILIADATLQRSDETLDRLVAAGERFESFAPAAGLARLLYGLNEVAGPWDSVGVRAEQIIDEKLLALATTMELAPPEICLSGRVTRVVRSIIDRRLERATTIEDDRVVVDETALRSIHGIAVSLRMSLNLNVARRVTWRAIPEQQVWYDVA